MNYRRRLLQNSAEQEDSFFPHCVNATTGNVWDDVTCKYSAPEFFSLLIAGLLSLACFCCVCIPICRTFFRVFFRGFSFLCCQNTKPDRTDEEKSATVERVLVHLRKMNPPAPSEPVTGLEDA